MSVALLLSPGWGLADSNNAPLLSATAANPTPAAFDVFGSTVAGMGNDRALVAAGDAVATTGSTNLVQQTLVTTNRFYRLNRQ